MASIPQTRLFCWEDVENLGDLQRLRLVLKAIPDEPLMQTLEAERGKGRNDYPVRPMWNSVLAGIVFQHPSVQSLRRELLRNDRLRWMCGFDPVMEAAEAVGGPDNYSRFLKNLMAHQGQIDEIFDALVDALGEELEGLGRHLAFDSKGIQTHARPRGKEQYEELREREMREGRDGRRDLDADFGKKTYRGTDGDGTLWEQTKKWFGYKLHLAVDATCELPVAYEVTRASRPDNKVAAAVIEDMDVRHPELLKGCEAAMADKAYDDIKIIDQLWDGGDPEEPRRILPVIPKRQDWKDGEETRPLLEGADNIVYDCQGRLYCHCWKTGRRRAMLYCGYERKRDTQKWRCPAAAYGLECESYWRCSGDSSYGRVVRVKREFDRRTFLPTARSGYRFERLYRERGAVERVNSRLDVSFGFERHYIRGLAKMRLRCSLALVVMLAMALGRARENKEKEGKERRSAPTVRSLVGAA
ncbi:MAG: transposase [Candidatus Brocadiia bacterium]